MTLGLPSEWLGLPSRWVYVKYKNGKSENVANSDTLSEAEAQKYKERWESARKTKVVSVTLEDGTGKVLKSYDF